MRGNEKFSAIKFYVKGIFASTRHHFYGMKIFVPSNWGIFSCKVKENEI